jgi:hypothetical protein
MRTDIDERLWRDGWATLGPLLSPADCAILRALYADDAPFRKTVDMQRHRFGEGSYRYFAYPLPAPVQRLRETLYEALSPIANAWTRDLGIERIFPPALADFLAECRAAGQSRPTPLLLRYDTGGYNCLHQDLYGAVFFPFQVIVGLSDPGQDFDGGELMLVETRPRAQSIGRVLPLGLGEAVVITTRVRPVKGRRGFSRAAVRHGVSRVTRGARTTLGIIFHDAD